MDQGLQWEFYLAEDTDGFSRAVNRTIYDAFRTFTLTDVVDQVSDHPAGGDSRRLAARRRWQKTDAPSPGTCQGQSPQETHKPMTLHLTLAPGQDGTYPATFATNQGERPEGSRGRRRYKKIRWPRPSCAGESRRWRRWRWRGRPGIPPL